MICNYVAAKSVLLCSVFQPPIWPWFQLSVLKVLNLTRLVSLSGSCVHSNKIVSTWSRSQELNPESSGSPCKPDTFTTQLKTNPTRPFAWEKCSWYLFLLNNVFTFLLANYVFPHLALSKDYVNCGHLAEW
jgi:hypothetical protein